MRTWRLDYENGDFLLVSAPPLLIKSRGKDRRIFEEIRAHHIELHKAIEGRHIWGADGVEEELYAEFSIYFKKIARLVSLTTEESIACDRLTPKSRHQFFVCTDPIEVKGKLIANLSGLEQLMGFKFNTIDKESLPITGAPTTGEVELDILVDSLLIFKRNAWKLPYLYSLEELSKLSAQANSRMDQAQQKQDEEIPEESEPTWDDEETFTQSRDSLADRLSSMGVDLPPMF